MGNKTGSFDIFTYIKTPYEVSDFYGYECANFIFEGRQAKIVKPKKIRQGNPWVWKARFWGEKHAPQTEVALLEQGFYVVYCDVAELFGNAEAIRIWDRFYFFLQDAGFSPKSTMIGLSRGGFYAYRWAIQYPERIACIYADAPVLDMKSWPGGKGIGIGSPENWEIFKQDYGFTTDEEAISFAENPLDMVDKIVTGGYPIIHVVGDIDKVVPVKENTDSFEQKINELGGCITVIHKPNIGHHPHGLDDPKPIVDFILTNALEDTSDILECDSLDIFLLIGQSNMSGRGDIVCVESFPGIYALTKENKWQIAKDPLHFDKSYTGVGPGITFAKELKKEFPEYCIGLVPCAVGGTSISKWMPGAYDESTRTYPYDDMVKRLKTALKSGKLRGILWHQGEGDYMGGNYKQYEARFDTLLYNISRDIDINMNDVPIIIGEIGRFLETESPTNESIKINEVLNILAKKYPNIYCVSSEGLNHKGDGVHFDTRAAKELGKRYAEGYKTLIMDVGPTNCDINVDSLFQTNISMLKESFTDTTEYIRVLDNDNWKFLFMVGFISGINTIYDCHIARTTKTMVIAIEEWYNDKKEKVTCENVKSAYLALEPRFFNDIDEIEIFGKELDKLKIE
ncbi:sialate O-acetylesterase [Dysgonomonas sp. 520]|uniref:sialate O-acetylesterase n=1 Tax=Dysgonomonas sp. 520 TaxID=2302931 RepID=UPI001625A9A5|nr:sialate O-acetylesterase [Dysgonomonas sp. 520]